MVDSPNSPENPVLTNAESSNDNAESTADIPTSPSNSESTTTMDVSDLCEDDLRQLVEILKVDHPNALSAALGSLSRASSNSFGEITFKGNEDGDNQCEDSAKFDDLKQKKGCYLFYDPSSAKLKLKYTSIPVQNAIGFYSSPSIPEFKYRKNFGRADLIGNCASGVAGRKNYYSGWCQFIRAARSAIISEEKSFGSTTGEFWIFPRDDGQQGLDVDIYVYDAMATYQTILLHENKALQGEILNADAVTCLPQHSDVFEEVKQMELNRWLVRANNVGANIRFKTAAAGPDTMVPNAQISLVERAPVSTVVDEPVDLGEVPAPAHGETKGCYLLYDADSCALRLQYSSKPVRNAIGFYCAGAGHSIRGFKFTKNFGRAELIGNCASGVAGRKNYYSGWCQFIRAARAVNGPLWIYPRCDGQPGLDVDIYVYYKEPNERGDLNLDGKSSTKLEERVECNITNIDAVACLPKHADFFSEVKNMDMNRWLTKGNNVGATSRFE